MLSITNYVRAQSLEEAWLLNQKRSNKIIGGMLWLKMSSGRVGTAIDLTGLGLDKIEETDTEFSIGAMTTLREVETHSGFNGYTCGAAREALRHIVGVQFRNLATVGGSIFGRFGFSDVLTLFMCLDSYVELYKGGIVSMDEFARMPRDNDILVRVIVKKTPLKAVYMSVRNTKTDFPVLACAASKTENGMVFSIGARPAKAVRFEFSGSGAEAAAELAAECVPTGSNMRGSAEYRKHLVKVLVKRSYNTLEENARCISRPLANSHTYV